MLHAALDDRANLFTTPEARDLLFKEAGVVFVKDSSANKCGVICSSFEIVSSMLMSSDEFTNSKVCGGLNRRRNKRTRQNKTR